MGAPIPEAEIHRVMQATDLAALIRSRGVDLVPHGAKDLIGRCPFHPEGQTPDLVVNRDNGLWHCLTCGKAGNAIRFVADHDGVSFRHAFELLTAGRGTVFASQPRTRHCTVPRLPCPLDPVADDVTLFAQVVAYYQERLKASAGARGYLAARGLDDGGTIERFQLGFADRSLGLRLSQANRKEGAALRRRLQALGLWRPSGHEHFNGCVVVPVQDRQARPVSLYGRRVAPGRVRDLYTPGPHRGLFNREAFAGDELILCGTVLDALTFWRHGFRNASALFGAKGFTDELWEALARVKRVRLAYGADEIGDRAAERDAERLRAAGIEVFRIVFPRGMGACEYARNVQPGRQSLAVLVNSAIWVGSGKPWPTGVSPPDQAGHRSTATLTHDDHPPNGRVPGPFAEPAGGASAIARVSADTPDPVAPGAKSRATAGVPPAPTALEVRGDAWFLALDGREYRVGGLEKTLGTDGLKVTLRLRVTTPGSAWFHLDQVDLTRDAERRRFIERAAEETGLLPELLRRDLGRLLLGVEAAQADLARPASQTPVVTLSPEEREEALAWLQAPDLLGRLRHAFRHAGIVGEENNALVAYLAGVSRKLDRPLAIIVRSASAAGKTTLMDAVLSFFPEEERIKYSAMTGQSLYYLGETNLRHKILAVVEEAGAGKASHALKLLQSEGGLTIASTGKDPATGRMVTREYRVEGPVAIFLTTTAIDLDEELQNRCLTLAVDESPDQTGRIHQWQRERRTLAGLSARQERQALLRVLRNAQRLLAPVEVLNPFAPDLTFATGRTRSRRDHEKYLTLIDAIALLHQHQRARRSLPEGPMGAGSTGYIEATLDDIALANELAPEVLSRSLDELPPQTRRLLGHIRDLAKQRGPEHGPKAAARFSRRELREACGWSLTQVTVHLDRLVALEYLAVRHGRLGSAFVYEILFDVDAPEVVAPVGLIDVSALRREYEGNLTGSKPGVSGQKGHLTGGAAPGPVPSNAGRADAWTEPHGVTGLHIRARAALATS